MIRLTALALERFGLLATMKLALMVAVVVGCLGAAALSPPPAAEVAVVRCDGARLVLDAGTGTVRTVACP